ncbi:MAG: bifunctional polysaccharide deacetylase/glycosyltransferase family 2 protein [Sciscionella sp.]
MTTTPRRGGGSATRGRPQEHGGRRRVLPRAKWILLTLAVLMLGCLLAVNGLVNSDIGDDSNGLGPGPDDKVPASVTDGGPIIDASRATPRSYSLPRKTVALTFDDGPSPQWTPKVLAVLRKYHVPATFFVVGSVAARNPGLLRDIRASGSAIGLHTFTHPDLARVSDARRTRELWQTQLALAGATGEKSYLLRPPYSAGPDSIDNLHLKSIRKSAKAGYLVVLSDVDGEDWQRPGAAKIVENATPKNGKGAIVLLHDAGGNRSESVKALGRLIPKLRAEGYRFTTVTDAVGLPRANSPATLTERLLGKVMLAAVALSDTISGVMGWLLLVSGVLIVARLLLMVVLAGRHRRQRRSPTFTWGRPIVEPVSVLVPVYNEKENVAATVRSLVASDHPVEVIVVDDGSTDGTADVVESLCLPNVTVIRKENGGKASALNTGIALARNELIVMIDGDTIFEPDTVRRLVAPFASPDVGAVAGNAKVANRSGLLAKWQHIEYVIGFNIDRRVYDLLGCMPTVPGAVGAYRRSTLVDVGGLSEDTLAEDTDLTMAICRGGWRVIYQEDARAWTEAPVTLPQLWRQRYRWTYGTMQSMWKHRGAVLASGAAGRFGRVGLVQLALFQVLLPLLAPLVDVFLVYGLLFLDRRLTIVVWCGMLAIQLIGALFAFRLEGERIRVLLLLPAQQFVYRQLMYAVLLKSAATALAGVRLGWQKLRRTGGLDMLLASRSSSGT